MSEKGKDEDGFKRKTGGYRGIVEAGGPGEGKEERE